MGKISKLIFGTALVGAAAYGLYSYLTKVEEDEDYMDSDLEDIEKLEGAPSDEEAEAEEDFEEDDFDVTAETIKQAANRAYTTIQHGSQQAVDRMKEAVGPKGEEVLNTVEAAATEVGKTVKDSATKIREILREKNEEGALYDEAAEAAKAEGKEEAPVSAEAVKSAEEKEEAPVSEETVKPAEASAESEAPKVEQFFDDEA